MATEVLPDAGSSSVLDIECIAERAIESDPRSEVEVPEANRLYVSAGNR